MTNVAELISVESYLSTMYHPDMDFVDGQLEDRNLGELSHSDLQGRMYMKLKLLGYFAFIEARLQISAARYRVPDICVLAEAPLERKILVQPPSLCIEILSPEDRLTRVRQVVEDYHSIGVPVVWILDPEDQRAYVSDPNQPFREVLNEVSAFHGELILPLSEIFSPTF